MRILRDADTPTGHPDCKVELRTLRRFWVAAGATPALVGILATLWDSTDATMSTVVEVRTLADELGISSGNAQKHLSHAIDLGILRVTAGGQRFKTTRQLVEPHTVFEQRTIVDDLCDELVDNSAICAPEARTSGDTDDAVDDPICAPQARTSRGICAPQARVSTYREFDADPAVGDGEGSGEGKGKPLPSPSEFVRAARARIAAQESAGFAVAEGREERVAG